MSQERSVTLDVVRGTAIFAVVAVHSMQGSLVLYPDGGPVEGDRLFTLISYLRFGPELFFALSGWLLFSIQVNRVETRRMYWARRIARIWPLWLLFTLLTYVGIALQWPVTPAGSGLQFDSSGLVVAGLVSAVFLGWLNAGTWNVPAGGWSIQSEMGHYGLFWLLRRATPLVLLASVLFGFSTWFLADFLQNSGSGELRFAAESWIRLGLFGTWPFFVAGGLAYLWSSGHVRVTWKDGVALALVVLVGWRVPLPFGRLVEAAVATITLFALAMLVNKTGIGVRPLASLGRTSYFIYFAHFWVISVIVFLIARGDAEVLLRGNFVEWFLVFGCLLAFTLAVSWGLSKISWNYFENPFIKRARSVK